MSFAKKIESHYRVAASNELEALKNYAVSCNRLWAENEGVEWDEAESLVELCKKAVNLAGTETKPLLKGIIQYAAIHSDLDSCDVGGWPDEILEALKKDGIK